MHTNQQPPLDSKREAHAETEALRLLRQLCARLPSAIFHYRRRPDQTGCIPFASDGLALIHGVKPDLVREDASAFFAQVQSDDRESVIRSLEDSADTLKPWHHEYRVVIGNGSVRWLAVEATPEREADGSVLWHGCITDITRRKLSEQRLRSALDHVSRQQFAIDQHAIVAMTDVAGTIVYANDKFCEISGYSFVELVGQNHRLIKSGIHPPAFFTAMYEVIARGKVWHGEICNRAKDGRLYWVATTIVPFFDEAGRIERYVSIRTDITALVRNRMV
ncbi:MAG: PAS domain-containing protein [Verrucomicrobia bacterium]|nr:PAS domain-containing protein [Verrucomicrobiota bacterium]